MATLEVGDVAPNFALPDRAGQPHILNDALRQGPVLLVFWKVGCATCRLSFPYLERLHQAYPGGRWQVWGVGQDDVAAVDTFLHRVGPVTFPLLLDYPGYVVSRQYDPVATPTLFLIAPDGRIVQTSAGFSKADLNALSQRLATDLGVAPVVVAPADDGNPPFKPG